MKYKVYGTDRCPYCSLAKNLLERKKLEYEYLTVDPASDILQELKDYTKWSTVPLVFEVDDKGIETFVGGFSELNAKLRRI